jgi:hypothetical protein
MCLLGGLSDGTLIHASHGWPWITSQSQVCLPVLWCYLDLIIILATSVDVERVFSKGRILLSHLRARLSVQSTRALMCVGEWSRMGFVKDSDVRVAMTLSEVGDNKEKLTKDWDFIKVE